MAKNDGPETYYICQTYEERKMGRAGTTLAIKSTIACQDVRQAENRAERSYRAGNCVGADAFSVTIDPDTGEAGSPTFFARHGKVPELDPI